MQTDRKYWFPAKRYGWGWGIPRTWQGWAVLVGFVALISAGTTLFPPRTELAAYLGYVVVLAAILIAVVWMTGEPPRWRWGEDRRE
jgi:uncharacterized membrane protein YhaH (DUF805 family)